MLTRNGRRKWIGEGGMDAGGSPPMIAGDVGFCVGQNHSTLYYCDVKGNSPVYKPFQLGNESVIAGPAFADGLLYIATIHGETSCIQVDRS
jgi:hypothetical protein